MITNEHPHDDPECYFWQEVIVGFLLAAAFTAVGITAWIMF
jgi:hypothetical protein